MQAAGFENKKSGEVTVFLCLIFLVMLSLVGALIESVSVHLSRNQRRANLEMALESVFAEYDRELLEEYEIFALDGSYGTKGYDSKLLEERLDFYGAVNTEDTVRTVEFLSDCQGMAFYRQVIQYMRNKYGLPENASESESNWAAMTEASKDYLTESKATDEEIERMLEEAQESLPSEDNPIEAIADIKKRGLVGVALPKEKTVSNLSVRSENLASVRKLQKGNYPVKEETDLTTEAMFRQYLAEQFYSYADEEQSRSLSYELEYLLIGGEKDAKNLEKVLERIFLLRFASNYACLMTDNGRKNEARLLAASLCSLLTVTGISLVVEQAILLAWAYGESVAELQILMDGGSIATIKKKGDWIVSLEELLRLGSHPYTKEKGTEKGMVYEDFVCVLLALVSREKLCMRALDLIECDLGLQADACVTRIQIESNCKLRRGLLYKFRTQYAYR